MIIVQGEAQIRALIDDRVDAIRARDVDRALSSIAPDALLFDIVKPLQARGVEVSRQRTEAWSGSFQGPIGVEIRDHSRSILSFTSIDG